MKIYILIYPVHFCQEKMYMEALCLGTNLNFMILLIACIVDY